jgi:chromosome segregation ATPase
MEQQKVFPTSCFGFDKKVVLDYIYEQDTAAKAKEAEFEQRAGEYEAQINELQSKVEELNAQLELTKAQLYSEKESSSALRGTYDKLKSDADQLVQTARNKDNELQIQMELNRQLQNRNADLENRISALTQELEEARKLAAEDSGEKEKAAAEAAALLEEAKREAEAIREKAAAEATPEVLRLRDELSSMKESIGKMLSQFEGEISKLDKGGDEKGAPSPEKEQGGDFFPEVPSRQEPAGRVKVKIRK